MPALTPTDVAAAEWVRWGFVALLVIETAIEAGLAWLNLRHTARHGATVPPALAAAFTADDARRAQAYAGARGRVEALGIFVDAAALAILLLSGALGWWDGWVAAHLATWPAPHRFVVFLVGLTIPLGLVGLPLSLYRTFGVEARFGFNRLTFGLWLRDRLKGLALAVVIGLPLLYAVWAFMALTGAAWWLWLFAFLAAWQLLLVWLYPAVIARWFNRFTPLPAGDLRARVEALAGRAGFRTGGIFVVDAGKRSAHSNAYFTGLVRPRIVLFDTLVKTMSLDETEAVLAHEMGHWREGHVRRMIALTLVLQFAGLWALSWAVAWPPLFAAFGLAGPSYAGAIALAVLAGGAVTFWLGPLLARLSRRHEYQADAYSRRLVGGTDGLQTALVKLGRENLTNLAPHPWYSAYHYSHPTLPERLAALARS
jgi:STE24 endopeptidase